MSTINLYKHKKIIDNLRNLGFEFHQAGTINQYHELNLIVENGKQNRQYWISKSFGKYEVIYREDIHNVRAKQHNFYCKSQKEVCEKFNELIAQ